MWVKQNNGTAVDESFYATCVRDLLRCTNTDEYKTKFVDVRDRWSPGFVEYYEEHLITAVTMSAEFAIQQLNIVRVPYAGITNNVSESYNRVLKDFQNWKVNNFKYVIICRF